MLLHGPMPSEGWKLTRGANGKVIYVVARSKDAQRFQRDATKLFAEEVMRRELGRTQWCQRHCQNVGKMWKNQFMLWIWEQIDAG